MNMTDEKQTLVIKTKLPQLSATAIEEIPMSDLDDIAGGGNCGSGSCMNKTIIKTL
jgi:hypothetical protein